MKIEWYLAVHTYYKVQTFLYVCKVQVLWEDHKTLQNHFFRFDVYYMQSNLRRDFKKWCGLLRISELYTEAICWRRRTPDATLLLSLIQMFVFHLTLNNKLLFSSEVQWAKWKKFLHYSCWFHLLLRFLLRWEKNKKLTL